VNAAGQSRDGAARVMLETLLAEINTVAIRLRHSCVEGAQTQQLPAASQAVLAILQREGALSVPAIARFKSTSRQNVQIIINRLRAAGLVELSINPAHKRSELVLLTGTGDAVLEKAENQVAPTMRHLAEQFGHSELQAWLESVRKLRKAMTGETVTPVAKTADRRGPAPMLPEVEIQNETSEDSELPVNLL